MKALGRLKDGALVRCGEIPKTIQCIGRAVNGAEGCTCATWTADELADAEALGWSGTEPHCLRRDIERALDVHYDKSRGIESRHALVGPAWKAFHGEYRAWRTDLNAADKLTILRVSERSPS